LSRYPFAVGCGSHGELFVDRLMEGEMERGEADTIYQSPIGSLSGHDVGFPLPVLPVATSFSGEKRERGHDVTVQIK
jgi:hypothetical protein